MFIERVKINFKDRKENIEQHYSSLNDLNIESEIFNIGKIVLDREEEMLHLYNVEWVSAHNYKNEDDIVQFLKENLNILIYNYLL